MNAMRASDVKRLGCLAVAILATSAMLASCTTYVPGRQTYWDSKVRDMCNADGGTTIYEAVLVGEDEYRRLGGSAGRIPLPEEKVASPNYPYVARMAETVLNEANPRVVKREIVFVRRADGKTLARAIEYSRVGGDIPSFGHPTVVTCPAPNESMAAIRKVFVVQGGPK